MKIFLLFLAGITSIVSFAQDGSLDTSFGNNGYAVTDFGFAERGSAIALQADGKIVMFGIVGMSNGFTYGLLRHLPDGQLDTSFGIDGLVTTSIGDSYHEYFSSLHIQQDQKIIVSTTFLNNSEIDYMVMRYLPNGDFDLSFGVNGIVRTNLGTDILAATNLLSDGKILAGGSTTVDIDNSILLVKYLPDGSLDPSFGTNGMIVHFINNEAFKVFGIKVQNDGKILVPYRTEENFVNKFQIARFLPTGVLDTSFGNNGIVELDSTILVFHSTITVQDDGKILTSIRNQSGTSIIRLLPNGDLDSSFGNNGTVEIESDIFTCFKILTQTDEKIIVFGVTFGFEPDLNRTYRLNQDGSLDNTFGINGFTALGFEGADIVFQENGKLLVAGNTFFYGSSGENFAIARLNNGPLSVAEFEKNQITIYPNPSNGIFNIEREFSETTTYQINDITGKIIVKDKLADKQTQIDLSAAQSGVYFLKTSDSVFRLLKN